MTIDGPDVDLGNFVAEVGKCPENLERFINPTFKGLNEDEKKENNPERHQNVAFCFFPVAIVKGKIERVCVKKSNVLKSIKQKCCIYYYSFNSHIIYIRISSQLFLHSYQITSSIKVKFLTTEFRQQGNFH